MGFTCWARDMNLQSIEDIEPKWGVITTFSKSMKNFPHRGAPDSSFWIILWYRNGIGLKDTALREPGLLYS